MLFWRIFISAPDKKNMDMEIFDLCKFDLHLLLPDKWKLVDYFSMSTSVLFDVDMNNKNTKVHSFKSSET